MQKQTSTYFIILKLLFRHFVDIFGALFYSYRWHKIIFETISAATISREEAMSVTNEDVVKRLPKERQEYAFGILDKFCEGFNKSFFIVKRLFECEE